MYGGGGDFGAADGAIVKPLENQAVDTALSDVSRKQRFDIFATHESVAVEQIVNDLPGQVRQTNAGHLHAQNSDKDIEKGGPINLVEGSTGAGGLDNLARGTSISPVEFSVESVAANCEFTKITRFQVTNIASGVTTNLTTAPLPQVNASTRYLRPQHLPETRVCDTNLGL